MNSEKMPKLGFGLISRSGKASDGIACGQCEAACPQHLPVIELMKEAAEILGR